MDTTMQSPVRRTIPLPFSEGIPITIPSGPHFYPVKNWVGSISQGNTEQPAFEALSRHATPFQTKLSVDGGLIDIPVLGSVRQHVDPDHLTIVNTTEPGHFLHPGNVFRSIVREGDDFYVVTHGYGTGVLPELNEGSASAVWYGPDHQIRHELNPYKPLGYPMDEMNAVADGGRALGIVSNQPMPDWPFPPPIFGRR